MRSCTRAYSTLLEHWRAHSIADTGLHKTQQPCSQSAILGLATVSLRGGLGCRYSTLQPSSPAHRSLPPGWLDGTLLDCTSSRLARWVTAGVQGVLEVAVEGSRSECPRPSVPSDSADQQHFDSVETDEFARRRMLPIQTSSFSRLPHWSRHDADSPAVAKASWALRLWFSCTALAGIYVSELGHRPALLPQVGI